MPVNSAPIYFPTIEEIKAFLANRSRLITLDDIASRCDVSVSWIKQVLSGEIENPSYKNITAVYKYVAEIENGK